MSDSSQLHLQVDRSSYQDSHILMSVVYHIDCVLCWPFLQVGRAFKAVSHVLILDVPSSRPFSSWLCSRVHCTLMLIIPSTPLHLIKPIVARSKQIAIKDTRSTTEVHPRHEAAMEDPKMGHNDGAPHVGPCPTCLGRPMPDMLRSSKLPRSSMGRLCFIDHDTGGGNYILGTTLESVEVHSSITTHPHWRCCCFARVESSKWDPCLTLSSPKHECDAWCDEGVSLSSMHPNRSKCAIHLTWPSWLKLISTLMCLTPTKRVIYPLSSLLLKHLSHCNWAKQSM